MQTHRKGESTMQFGIFSVGDVTTDPTTGRTPTENERIKAILTIAQKAEEVVPVLRREFEAMRPAHVPDGPTHAGLVSARDAAAAATPATAPLADTTAPLSR
jgi:hypothetical protein